MTYETAYNSLQMGVCILTFLKKDGTIRNMLATRNTRIASMYGQFDARQFEGHDRRCGIENGNIAVYDLIIDETRSFNISRLISLNYLGNVSTREQLDMNVETFKKFAEEYSKNNPMEINMDTTLNGVQ